MKRSNDKENEINQEKKKKKRFVSSGKKRQRGSWNFFLKIKFHSTNETHNKFHQTGALVSVESF